MAKTTMREQFIAALTEMGEKKVMSRSQKYVTFTRAAGGFYFIGDGGALRFGRASSKSLPCSDALKRALLSRRAVPPSDVQLKNVE